MPNGDFILIVMESRLWRTSRDTYIWVKDGWGHKTALYDRRDPTRTLWARSSLPGYRKWSGLKPHL